MAAIQTVTLRGKKVPISPHLSKADLARAFLKEGYSVSEISKAVPMAYSQVHSIWKKEGAQWATPAVAAKAPVRLQTATAKSRPAGRAMGPGSPFHVRSQETQATRTKAKQPIATRPPRFGIGKLRTPGLPSDIEVGECANCGHDLAVRGTPTGYVLVHVNTSAEEYLGTTQFCQGIPKSLVR